jgi:predicted metal-dependent hydrolase
MSMEKVTVSDIDIEVERKNIKHIHLAVYPPDARVHISAPEFMTLESLQLYAIDHRYSDSIACILKS